MRSLNTFNKFKGTGVAVTTPFKDNKIDYPTLEKIIKHKIDNGIDYLVALGSTGEAGLLSKEEKHEILQFFVKVVDGSVPIVAGNFSFNSTNAALEHIQAYSFDGISALMISPPAYVKPSQQGIYNHFESISKISSLPIILYNVPSRTQSFLNWETVINLAKNYNNIVGIKEASSNIVQMNQIAIHAPEHFVMVSGDDEASLACIASGGHGLISVVGNILPKQTSDMINLALQGKLNDAIAIQQKLFPLYTPMYKEGNPTGVKAAYEILGFGSSEVRSPLVKLSESSYKILEKILNDF